MTRLRNRSSDGLETGIEKKNLGLDENEVTMNEKSPVRHEE
jgi:hypothetical protein